ncbi:VOC family protein [Kitasatospora sp. NPDC056138]|uniref:VOC family protein n=1 Tax=Kitasatospora sp. NPDC056138 TaxID=3345724 RepID=UPI0035E0DFB2
MRFSGLGLALLTDDTVASSRFYIDHFGFKPVVDFGWYVSLHHDEHPAHIIDFVERGHPSMPEDFRAQPTAGVCLAFVVEDATAAQARLRAAGVEIAVPLRDEPWGQRRFNVWSPEGVLIEVLQPIDPDPEWSARQTA